MPHDPNMPPPEGMPRPEGMPPAPPPGGPPGGPPPEAAAPSAPAPKAAFTVKKLKSLVSQLNDTLKALLGEAYEAMPENQREVRWEPPTKESKLAMPIPPEVFLPLMAVEQAVQKFGGPAGGKYDLALADLVDDPGVMYTTGVLRKMERDKKLLKALQEATGPEGEAPAPEPGSDERMMQAM